MEPLAWRRIISRRWQPERGTWWRRFYLLLARQNPFPAGAWFGIDPLGSFFLLILSHTFFAVALYSPGFLQRMDKPEYHASRRLYYPALNSYLLAKHARDRDAAFRSALGSAGADDFQPCAADLFLSIERIAGSGLEIPLPRLAWPGISFDWDPGPRPRGERALGNTRASSSPTSCETLPNSTRSG